MLFDTGEDVQRAYEIAGFKMNRPLSIFITHMHGDHVIGLPGLLFRLNLLNRDLDIDIFGPIGLFFYLVAHRLTVGLATQYKIHVTEIDLEQGVLWKYPAMDVTTNLEGFEAMVEKIPIQNEIIKDTSRYSILALVAEHTARQNFSFVFREAPRPGKFDPERAIALHIPRGSLWGRMQQGQTITLKDGTEIDPVRDGVIGPARRGREIVISGDTRPSSGLLSYVQENEIDLLIHEATYSEDLQEMAREKKHSTVREACEVAKGGRVKQLALTHFSSRYIDDLGAIELEARKYFDNVIIARDNLSIEL
jgi:ribonuclease Z